VVVEGVNRTKSCGANFLQESHVLQAGEMSILL
jgi:hypothetical protein